MKNKSLLIIFGLVVVLTVGFFVGRNSIVCKICAPEDVDFSLLWEAWHEIEENYVDPENFDYQKMVNPFY